jgi:uncharacterized protein YdeI (YjbR/CyaY-like superfamily)
MKRRTAGRASLAQIPVISFASAEAWSEWLAANHAASPGVWLKLPKKSSKKSSVNGPEATSPTYSEAVDVAVCWGWIDGQKQKHDGDAWLQKFTPRGARSLWSSLNRDRVQALMRAGRMKPAGLAEVERAKRDGRWRAAYAPPSRAAVPEDLAAALAANARAAAFFSTLNAANRYAILFRIETAKKPETRAARIARFVAMLARHEQLHP